MQFLVQSKKNKIKIINKLWSINKKLILLIIINLFSGLLIINII